MIYTFSGKSHKMKVTHMKYKAEIGIYNNKEHIESTYTKNKHKLKYISAIIESLSS